MKITPQQYAQALHDSLSQTNSNDHDRVMDNFVKILYQNSDSHKFSEIEQNYLKLSNADNDIKQAEVTFAQSINPKILDELNKVIQGKAEFKSKIDNEIVGGVIVKIDDILIDASVRTQLENLNSSLKQ